MEGFAGTSTPQLNVVRAAVDSSARKTQRVSLPNRRNARTWEARIGPERQAFSVTAGEYPDGRIGEIFIDSAVKQDSALSSALNLLAVSVSLGLQHGVPLDEYVDAFIFTRFPPSGIIDGPGDIRFASSVADWIFRTLAIHYLGRDDLATPSYKEDDEP